MVELLFTNPSHRSDGRSRYYKYYATVGAHTALDCLKALSRSGEVRFVAGNRDAEHDVGFDSACDHDVYRSFEDFLESGDFERYWGDQWKSHYSFEASWRDQPFSLIFSDDTQLTFLCEDEALDLDAILEGAGTP